MMLIDIEPYFWELYTDHDGHYLNVLINKSACSWEKSIRLDAKTVQDYFIHGKDVINSLANRIESSQLCPGSNAVAGCADVTAAQSLQMSAAFMRWKIHHASVH